MMKKLGKISPGDNVFDGSRVARIRNGIRILTAEGGGCLRGRGEENEI